jgi:hypothetical protein
MIKFIHLSIIQQEHSFFSPLSLSHLAFYAVCPSTPPNKFFLCQTACACNNNATCSIEFSLPYAASFESCKRKKKKASKRMRWNKLAAAANSGEGSVRGKKKFISNNIYIKRG